MAGFVASLSETSWVCAAVLIDDSLLCIRIPGTLFGLVRVFFLLSVALNLFPSFGLSVRGSYLVKEWLFK